MTFFFLLLFFLFFICIIYLHFHDSRRLLVGHMWHLLFLLKTYILTLSFYIQAIFSSFFLKIQLFLIRVHFLHPRKQLFCLSRYAICENVVVKCMIQL